MRTDRARELSYTGMACLLYGTPKATQVNTYNDDWNSFFAAMTAHARRLYGEGAKLLSIDEVYFRDYGGWRKPIDQFTTIRADGWNLIVLTNDGVRQPDIYRGQF